MIIQNRESSRRLFVETWIKYKEKQVVDGVQKIILDVILEHPEYHGMLDKGEQAYALEFPAETGLTNPFLHMGMHITIKEQVQSDRPAGIQALYRSLATKFPTYHDLEHSMMECLGESLWQAQLDNTMPDEAAYIECIRELK